MKKESLEEFLNRGGKVAKLPRGKSKEFEPLKSSRSSFSGEKQVLAGRKVITKTRCNKNLD